MARKKKTRATRGRDLLRVVTCGSVDDGKSTLIGRILFETGSVPKDQLIALESLSKRFGTVRGGLDYALLVDGLEAEREQGITIDVAYRYFGTKKRAFVLADTPGHEQYTRNMATGASNADVAVLLVDARAGITRQTMRHSRIAALLGIREFALVINKMDLVHYAQKRFDEIVRGYREFAATLSNVKVTAIPAAARSGDNVVARSKKMRWYKGPSVLAFLEKVKTDSGLANKPFRFPVQRVSRDTPDFRGFAGTIASGSVKQGESVKVARSGLVSKIARIVTADGDRARADAGEAVTLVLKDQLDISRGDLIAIEKYSPDVADQFAAHIVWFEEAPLLPGRNYDLRIGTQTVGATVTALKHKVELSTGDEEAGRSLAMNEIGFCNLATQEPVALDPYAENRTTGAFILIDRLSAKTVGAGMTAFALRRATNIRHQHYEVDKSARAQAKTQRPCIVWFTGLPSSGKSTVMNLVEQRLHGKGAHTYALDGDNMRGGLSRDLGFTDADRVENIRRAGEVAKLMLDAGLIVLCAFVSPFRAERRLVRDLVGKDEFIEVFVDTPLEVCIERDPKGLYRKAREGKAFHVTGIDSPYEPPQRADIHLHGGAKDAADTLAEKVIEELSRRGICG
jgi:bifunctional enzyme CysN/CysC